MIFASLNVNNLFDGSSLKKAAFVLEKGMRFLIFWTYRIVWAAWVEENCMYHYIQDKDFLRHLKGTCADIINQLVQNINSDSVMTVKACLVGSGGKNLIIQNEVGCNSFDNRPGACTEREYAY